MSTIVIEKTISGCMGPGSMAHNKRSFLASNVDAERTERNVIEIDDDIKVVYHELFDDALQRYNDKQTRESRKITDYYEHIRTGKQEKLFCEAIFQMGNKDDTPADGEGAEEAKEILEEFTKRFVENNPNLRVFGAYIHMDEATPHVHIDFVPFIDDSKRGLDTRVTLKGALAAMGYKGTGKRDTEWNRFIDANKELMATVMAEHDIGWLQKNTHEEHLDVYDYKVKMRKEELEALNTELETATKVIDAVEAAITQKQDDVAVLDKKIEAKTKSSQKLDTDIDKKKVKFDELAKKQIAIDEIDKIQVTKGLFGFVSLPQSALDYIMDCAKKYISFAKENISIKKLKEEIKEKDTQISKKDSKISSLEGKVKTLQEKLDEKESIKARMAAATEKRDLEAVNKENTILRNLLERLGFKKEMERELSQKNTKQTEVIR